MRSINIRPDQLGWSLSLPLSTIVAPRLPVWCRVALSNTCLGMSSCRSVVNIHSATLDYDKLNKSWFRRLGAMLRYISLAAS
jgi:hypothetical protein